MSAQIDNVKEKAKPWSQGTNWWIVGLEGIIVLVLGIYLLAVPAQAESILGRLIALYLIVAGVLQIFIGFRGNNEGIDDKIALVRGLVGLITGGLVILLFRTNTLDITFGRMLIVVGTLVYGLLGLYANRRAIGNRWGVVINSIVFVVIGLLFILGQFTAIRPLLWIGWLLVLGGVALLGYAYMLFRATQSVAPADSQLAAGAPASTSMETETTMPTDETPPAVTDTVATDTNTTPTTTTNEESADDDSTVPGSAAKTGSTPATKPPASDVS